MEEVIKIKKINVLYNMYREFLHRFEIDMAVRYGVLSRTCSVFTGPITALFIIIKFTPEFQGYYYAFGTLFA